MLQSNKRPVYILRYIEANCKILHALITTHSHVNLPYGKERLQCLFSSVKGEIENENKRCVYWHEIDGDNPDHES